jgi:hypothetical protein
MQHRFRPTWAIIRGDDPVILERLNGVTFLENAVGKFSGDRHIRRRFILSGVDEVIKKATKLGCDHSWAGFEEAKGVVSQRQRPYTYVRGILAGRGARQYGKVERVIVYDPLYPFIYAPTIEDAMDGLCTDDAAVPVLDVVPGLVMPIAGFAAHRFYGTMPWENHSEWRRQSGHEWTLKLIRVRSVSESYHAASPDARRTAEAISRGRAFDFTVSVPYDRLYVPSGKSWGAYIPVDANFRYLAEHDVRVRASEQSAVSTYGSECLMVVESSTEETSLAVEK